MDFAELLKQSKKSLAEFSQSALFDPLRNCQLLVSGFDNEFPYIIEVSILEGKRKVDVKDSFGAIGWGANVAFILLGQREHQADMSLTYASYLVYEAKRCSEKTGAVGAFTAMAVQHPNVSDFKDRAYVEFVNDKGISQLEAYYRSFWKVPFIEFPELKPEFFTSPKGSQSPQ
jgi:hypothetical protein